MESCGKTVVQQGGQQLFGAVITHSRSVLPKTNLGCHPGLLSERGGGQIGGVNGSAGNKL